MIQITIPLPPSLNNAFTNAGRRGRIKSPEYRIWCDNADLLFKVRSAVMPRIEGTYGVMICVPLRMRGDIDNRIKPIVDLLVRSGKVDDDSKMQFVSVHRRDFVEAKTARVTVEAWRADD